MDVVIIVTENMRPALIGERSEIFDLGDDVVQHLRKIVVRFGTVTAHRGPYSAILLLGRNGDVLQCARLGAGGIALDNAINCAGSTRAELFFDRVAQDDFSYQIALRHRFTSLWGLTVWLRCRCRVPKHIPYIACLLVPDLLSGRGSRSSLSRIEHLRSHRCRGPGPPPAKSDRTPLPAGHTLGRHSRCNG